MIPAEALSCYYRRLGFLYFLFLAFLRDFRGGFLTCVTYGFVSRLLHVNLGGERERERAWAFGALAVFLFDLTTSITSAATFFSQLAEILAL